MNLVKSIDEIKRNMNTLDDYLSKKIDPEYSYALDKIKLGICFIADNSSREYKFYPSRFIGYSNNSMNKHENNTEKDGRETNPAISKILNYKLSTDTCLEEKYKAYCQSLGIKANERKRKYWKM